VPPANNSLTAIGPNLTLPPWSVHGLASRLPQEHSRLALIRSEKSIGRQALHAATNLERATSFTFGKELAASLYKGPTESMRKPFRPLSSTPKAKCAAVSRSRGPA